jgi:Glycosyl hydrolase family 12
MAGRRRGRAGAGAALAVLLVGAAAVVVTLVVTRASAGPSRSVLCQEQTTPVAGGTYIVQNNEHDSSAPECVRTDGRARFTVAYSSIRNPTDGSPGGYPSIYQGCHWGTCSSGGLAASPIKVADLAPGVVTTSWSATRGRGRYNIAYDIWFNKTPATSGQPDCAELMVWLDHTGSIQPYGRPIDSDAIVGGTSYEIWAGRRSWGDTITYEMTSATTSVRDLDIGTLAQDAVSRGYLANSCYLIAVEAGFELWRGGTGLKTDSFSVHITAAKH